MDSGTFNSTGSNAAASPGSTNAEAAPLQATDDSFMAGIRDWTRAVIVGFAIFMFVRIFIIQTFTIISGSMENTLLVGDFLAVSKSAYGATIPGTSIRLPGYSAPHRNDIVVFRSHHETPRIDLVKRLVGLPGDTLSMTNGVLSVNGVRQPEPFLKHTDNGEYDGNDPRMEWQASYLVDSARIEPYFPTRDNWGPLVVPPNSYFMMGDNREQSLDSRYWGFVPRRDILGRAAALYFSWDPRFSRFGHIRWHRIGLRLH